MCCGGVGVGDQPFGLGLLVRLDMYECGCVYVRVCECVKSHTNVSCCACKCCVAHTGWRRVIGCLIFIGHFPQKSPIICGSFAINDLQLKASYDATPPCTRVMSHTNSIMSHTNSIMSHTNSTHPWNSRVCHVIHVNEWVTSHT